MNEEEEEEAVKLLKHDEKCMKNAEVGEKKTLKRRSKEDNEEERKSDE